MTITPPLFAAFLKCPTKCFLLAYGEPPTGNAYADWVRTQNESYRSEGIKPLLSATPPDEVAQISKSAVLPASQPAGGGEPQTVETDAGSVALQISAPDLKSAKWRLAVDFVAQASSPAGPSSVPLLERAPGGTLPDEIRTDGTSAPQPQPRPWVLESRLHAVKRVPPEGRGKPAQFIPIRFFFTNKLTKDDKLLMAFDALVLSEPLGRQVALGKIIHGRTTPR